LLLLLLWVSLLIRTGRVPIRESDKTYRSMRKETFFRQAWSRPHSRTAQTTGNYVPIDPSTLPQVPGCTWFPDPQYPGMYQDWCGPDSDGNWYRPYDWYLLTGIWPPDYGLEGG
jgi:hypothetical protein